MFNYTATDGDGNTVGGTITIDVTDDVPTANADTNSVGEGSSVNGDVLTNDVLGADGGAPGGTVTGVATGSNVASPVSGNVGSDLAGAFGTLHLNSDGTYTYDADPDSVTANSVDHFVYTITDGDGDTSTVTLDITVNNVDLNTDNQTKTVFEAALDLVADDRTGTLNDDLAAGNAVGSDPTADTETVSGQLAVTGATTYAIVGSDTGSYGEIHINSDGSYTYTLTDPVDNQPHANDGSETQAAADVFTYQATDGDGNSVTGTITIDVVDDVPTAAVSTAGFSISHDETPGVDGDADDVAGPLSVFSGVSNTGDDPDVSPDGPGSVIGYATSSGAISSTGTVFGADGPAATGSVLFSLDISDAAGRELGPECNRWHEHLPVRRERFGGRPRGRDRRGGRDGSCRLRARHRLCVGRGQHGSVPVDRAHRYEQPRQIGFDHRRGIVAVVTATDGDGDVDTASTAIGSLISFQDDGPTLGAFTEANLPNEVGHVDGTFAFNWGADGLGGLTVTGPEIDGVTYTTTTDPDGSVTLHGNADTTEIFNLVVHPDGTYTFNLVTPDAGTDREPHPVEHRIGTE